MLDDFFALIRNRRRELKARYGDAYNQDAVAQRAGISRRMLSGIESRELTYLPFPETLTGLAQALDLTVVEMLAAAGYDVGVNTMGNASRRQIATHLDPADYIRVHYGIDDPQPLVTMLELAAEGQRSLEARARQRGDYQHPTFNDPDSPAEGALWTSSRQLCLA
jgi:transcriptional regulator with XRE-family HTH domain